MMVTVAVLPWLSVTAPRRDTWPGPDGCWTVIRPSTTGTLVQVAPSSKDTSAVTFRGRAAPGYDWTPTGIANGPGGTALRSGVNRGTDSGRGSIASVGAEAKSQVASIRSLLMA